MIILSNGNFPSSYHRRNSSKSFSGYVAPKLPRYVRCPRTNREGSIVILWLGIPIRTAVPPWLSAPIAPPLTDGRICSLVALTPIASNA